MRTQARGVASAVADVVVEKIVTLKPLWRRIPAGAPFYLSGLAPSSDPITPPWPDLIVSCGRRAGAISAELKRRSGGKLVVVYVQDPQRNPKAFDLVLAMTHDRVRGPNVVRLETAMHDVTPAELARAAEIWAPRLAHLPRPYVGVILGGPNGRASLGRAEAERLAAGITRLRRTTGGSALVVPSRRTPDEALEVFRAAAESDPHLWVWMRSGDNPYRGVLALADRLVVTSDSVSMVSEALATPHPVEVFPLELGKRHSAFIEGLTDRGLIRPFTGDPGLPPARPVLDARAEAAAAVRRVLAARGLSAIRAG